MAEFGENLKRVREEKGITQQTLADYLYVTRQAVSRWEGGSRYPDIMTAKKISQYFAVSLDDLLSDDDMKLYVEKSEILDTPVSKRIQIVLMALAFMCAMFHSIFYLCNTFIQGMLMYTSYEVTLKSVLLTLILGYGVYAAISDKLNPKLAAAFYTYYLAANLLVTIIGMISSYGTFSLPSYIGAIIYDMVFIIISIRFFSGDRAKSPIPLYFMIGFDSFATIVSFCMNVSGAPFEIFRDIFVLQILGFMQEIFFFVLLVFMTHTLDKKRKRAAR
ncbi:MAG: helix-turn-helix domain-containing protein [Lachnospiraceae bacterium]|nr:helix-turn-helix domain-containing protein [Lachnospiraceae bacterium]